MNEICVSETWSNRETLRWWHCAFEEAAASITDSRHRMGVGVKPLTACLALCPDLLAILLEDRY